MIRCGQPVLTFDVIQRDDDDRVAYHYVIVDLAAEYVSGEPQAADDAADAKWVRETELAELPVNPATRQLLMESFHFGK